MAETFAFNADIQQLMSSGLNWPSGVGLVMFEVGECQVGLLLQA